VKAELVNWDDACVPVLTHTLHYGLGVFEGVRCYICEDGRSAIFRLKEHTDRLFDSARIVQIEIPYTRDEINSAIRATLKARG
jgi:branched-chain amino acid aminotransferase